MKYKVIATGSSGNAVLIGRLLVDCGVSYKTLEPYIGDFDAVYITHIHKDHVLESTVRGLYKNGITILTHHKNKRTKKGNIIRSLEKKKEIEVTYIKDRLSIEDIQGDEITIRLGILLKHNVANYSIHIEMHDKKIFYMTDGGSLIGEEAKDYDYYFIETNYTKKKIRYLIKNLDGKYNRYQRSLEEHLSKEQAEKFFFNNGHSKSKLIRLHQSSSAY